MTTGFPPPKPLKVHAGGGLDVVRQRSRNADKQSFESPKSPAFMMGLYSQATLVAVDNEQLIGESQSMIQRA